MVHELVGQDPPMASIFACLEDLNSRIPRAPAYSPHTFVINFGAQPLCSLVLAIRPNRISVGKEGLTLQEVGGKVDTHIPIPRSASSRHSSRNVFNVDFLYPLQDTITRSETDNDLGHAEKERLDPELHELAVKVAPIAVAAYFRRGLQLYPTYGIAGLGLGVPY